ncbi:MAG: hypothetical protein JNL11_17815 [Bdellovibrionaceae bacterium]|nr:hypothetical protein [Pseudobdellovibrionaceae bacterium]
MKLTILFLMLTSLFFVACGPVKFSSSSSQPTDTDTTVKNTDVPPTDNGGGDNGNDDDDDDPTTPPPSVQTRDVTTSHTVESKQSKVDILLIADNSSSMNVDNMKLADRLTTFVSQLESAAIDWQMCLAVTSYITTGGYDYWGLSVSWGSNTTGAAHFYRPSSPWILRRQSGANLPAIFRYTLENNISTGGANTNDERGIKAAFWHTEYKDYNNCYRSGAAVAHIYISDEDERSVGGNAAEKYYANELLALEHDDYPSNLVDQVKKKLGNDVRFRANSIIVKPTDTNCLDIQDKQGTKAHYGRKYEDLSKMTGGGVGSICDTDYYNNLNFFNEVINDALDSMPLECNPVSNNVAVTITPNQSVQATVQGQSLVFNPSVKAGSTIVAKYKCNIVGNNRVPSSITEATPSLWSRIVNWFKSLF